MADSFDERGGKKRGGVQGTCISYPTLRFLNLLEEKGEEKKQDTLDVKK